MAGKGAGKASSGSQTNLEVNDLPPAPTLLSTAPVSITAEGDPAAAHIFAVYKAYVLNGGWARAVFETKDGVESFSFCSRAPPKPTAATTPAALQPCSHLRQVNEKKKAREKRRREALLARRRNPPPASPKSESLAVVRNSATNSDTSSPAETTAVGGPLPSTSSPAKRPKTLVGPVRASERLTVVAKRKKTISLAQLDGADSPRSPDSSSESSFNTLDRVPLCPCSTPLFGVLDEAVNVDLMATLPSSSSASPYSTSVSAAHSSPLRSPTYAAAAALPAFKSPPLPPKLRYHRVCERCLVGYKIISPDFVQSQCFKCDRKYGPSDKKPDHGRGLHFVRA